MSKVNPSIKLTITYTQWTFYCDHKLTNREVVAALKNDIAQCVLNGDIDSDIYPMFLKVPAMDWFVDNTFCGLPNKVDVKFDAKKVRRELVGAWDEGRDEVCLDDTPISVTLYWTGNWDKGNK